MYLVNYLYLKLKIDRDLHFKKNNNVNIIGKNLKKYREEKHFSQPDLCKKLELLGVNMFIADIYEIENNKRLVKDFEAKAFCKVLNITLNQLFDDTDKYYGN